MLKTDGVEEKGEISKRSTGFKGAKRSISHREKKSFTDHFIVVVEEGVYKLKAKAGNAYFVTVGIKQSDRQTAGPLLEIGTAFQIK
ncbi:MAG: hypothetical protein KKH60_10830 [Proteobacteria bacterium]|nr:hypothetical protein [Pseudomonadota bacterium]MBU1234692.1 hypothetical protein [Pseudomonadota bacterium]